VKTVDTNILVRIIADSESKQAEIAKAIIATGVASSNSLGRCDPVMALSELASTMR
jgi:hypothetical protein